MWLALWCAHALAHAELLQAEPTDGEALQQAPERVRLRFSEPVEAEFSPLKVYDQQGSRVDEDNARVDPDDARALMVDLEELPEGSYTVEWRVTSVDGHIIDGTYQFTVAAQAGEADVVEKPDPAPREDTEGGSSHIIHLAVLGLGALVVLALALLRRR